MKKLALAVSLVFAVCAPALAVEWQSFGPRAMGMGGAGVAMAQGPMASYWNPAGLGQVENPSGLEIPVGAQASVNGSLIQGIKDLNQLNQACRSGGANCTSANIENALNELGSGGANLDGGVGLDLKLGRLVLFANDLFYAGEGAYINPSYSFTTSGPNPGITNNSTVYINGISMTEIGVGYGHELPWVPGLNVGANLKAIVGITGYGSESIVSGTSPSFSKSNNTRQSVEPGIDLGALWDLNRLIPFLPFRPRVGITARNINDPSFKQPLAATTDPNGQFVSDNLSVGRQIRTGVAVSPFHWWNIAADADLTRNYTVLGQPSREIAVGTEINIFNRPWINIPLRAGISKNTALNDGPQWSLGAGLNFLHIIFDAAATIGQNQVAIQSQGQSKSIPEDIGGMFQFSVLFGGGAAPAKKAAGA